MKTTPKLVKKFSFNTESINRQIIRYAGFQALLSSGIKDPIEALLDYSENDSIEKCFDNLKNSLGLKRLRMHSSATVDGHLFFQFFAVILMSALRKQIR